MGETTDKTPAEALARAFPGANAHPEANRAYYAVVSFGSTDTTQGWFVRAFVARNDKEDDYVVVNLLGHRMWSDQGPPGSLAKLLQDARAYLAGHSGAIVSALGVAS